MELIQRNTSKAGYFKWMENEVEAAKMTYTWDSETKMRIEHTFVKPEFEGKGLGKKLLQAAIEYVQEKKVKIIPDCSFVKSQIEKNPALEDLISSSN